MKNIIVTLALLMGQPQAGAANIFKRPGQWFQDTGRATAKSGEQLLKAAGAIVSLGETERQREREKAEHARNMAAAARQAAEKQRNDAVVFKQRQLMDTDRWIKDLESANLSFTLIQNILDNGITTTRTLSSQIDQQLVQSDGVVQVLESQQKSVFDIISKIRQEMNASYNNCQQPSDHEECHFKNYMDTELDRLISWQGRFQTQMALFPQGDGRSQPLENWIKDLMEGFQEVQMYVQQAIQNNNDKISHHIENRKRIETELNGLTGQK